MRGTSDREESLTPAGRERGDGRKARRRFQPASMRYSFPPLRARGVGEVLDLAVEVLIARFAVLVGLAFLIWLPVAWIQEHLLHSTQSITDMTEGLVRAALELILTLGATLLIGAASCRISYRYLSPSGSAPDNCPPLTRALPGLVVVTLLNGLGVALAAPFTCGILSVFLWWRLLFAPCIVVLETANPIRAMRRSWELTRAGFWRWTGIFVVSGFFMLPLTLASVQVQAGAQDQLVQWFPNLGPVGVEAIGLVAFAFLMAVPSAFSSGALLTVFYMDALVRREGLDLSLQLQELQDASRSAPAGGPSSRPSSRTGTSAPPAGGLA